MIKINEFHRRGSAWSCYSEAHCLPAAPSSCVRSRTAKGCSLTALLRPDPIVPNFFLPPQQMEASMRMLSISSRPSTVSTGRPFLYCPSLTASDCSSRNGRTSPFLCLSALRLEVVTASKSRRISLIPLLTKRIIFNIRDSTFSVTLVHLSGVFVHVVREVALFLPWSRWNSQVLHTSLCFIMI